RYAVYHFHLPSFPPRRSSDLDSSGNPGWLLVADAEGMSVLTAWAAGKFDASVIAKGVKNTGVADKIAHRRIIIPGQVAVLSGERSEEHTSELQSREKLVCRLM